MLAHRCKNQGTGGPHKKSSHANATVIVTAYSSAAPPYHSSHHTALPSQKHILSRAETEQTTSPNSQLYIAPEVLELLSSCSSVPQSRGRAESHPVYVCLTPCGFFPPQAHLLGDTTQPPPNPLLFRKLHFRCVISILHRMRTADNRAVKLTALSLPNQLTEQPTKMVCKSLACDARHSPSLSTGPSLDRLKHRYSWQASVEPKAQTSQLSEEIAAPC